MAEQRCYPFQQRIWWTWDHRMNWGSPYEVGAQTCGCSNPYWKQPEWFLRDYRKAIECAACYGINGIIIWGFLRDAHGGIEASRKLCEYAREKGIRIIPGIGTSEYGGFYYEGDHPFNTHTYLQDHPDRRGINERGEWVSRLCPSNPYNQEWLRNGMRWLFREFSIGGVNLEHGDFAVCHCDSCRKARLAFPEADPDYYKDMAISVLPAIETAKECNPDAWISYATYTGFTPEMLEDPPAFVRYLPEYAVTLWTNSGMLDTYEPASGGVVPRGKQEGCNHPLPWPLGLRPPTKHSGSLIHQAGQWGQYGAEIPAIPELLQEWIRKSHAAGMECLVWYGEVSPDVVSAQINYRAFEFFSRNPEASLEMFAEECLVDLCGSIPLARDFIEIITRQDWSEETVEKDLRRANDVYLSFHWLPDFKRIFRPETARTWEWALHLCQSRTASVTAVRVFGGKRAHRPRIRRRKVGSDQGI